MTVQSLRFVDRNGKKILQMALSGRVEDGETYWDWIDVPLTEAADDVAT